MGGDRRSNLKELESAARYSIAFAADLPFDDHVWKIQYTTADQDMTQLWFTVAPDGDAAKNVPERERLREPFAAFLKSIIRLSEAARHKEANAYKALLSAGRYLYAQLERRGHDPIALTAKDFRQAEAAAPPKSRYVLLRTSLSSPRWSGSTD